MGTSRQDGRALRALVVEDNRIYGALVARALSADGMDADVAGDGRAAMVLMAKRSYDALVVDLSLPGMDGLELCRRVRGHGFRGRVALLTARDDVRLADRRSAGVDDYLVKPVSLGEVAQSLRRPRLVAVPDAGPDRPSLARPPRA